MTGAAWRGEIVGGKATVDFQSIVDAFCTPASIISVEKTGDGKYGDIRYIAGNKKYTDMIDIRLKNGTTRVREFISGALYTDYFPQNRSFEDVCYRAALKKEEVHTYAHISNVDVWFDIYAFPIDHEDADVAYCVYLTTVQKNADKVLDTLTTSRTANDVLKTCIRLHKADNLQDALGSVIYEIRNICNAVGCTVLLLNNDEAEYSILATDYAEGSNIKRVTEFNGFYDIANSWKGMLGDEVDCIIIRDKNDMEYIRKINNPWYLTLVEAGVESVVLFPLRQGKELLGFIWAINFDTNKTMRIKETLELTTFFISSHIARYKVLKRLTHMGYTDTLTGLPNRFAFTDYITELIERGERFAAVSIDVNNFKSINDTLGFEAGNKVLIELATRWKALADNDGDDSDSYITRISGDEFFLVIRNYGEGEKLKEVISRYDKALSDILTVDGCDLYVSASFGYAEFPADADTVDSVISNANAAMNEIKRLNRSDHILKFSQDIIKNEQLLAVENMIRAALDNDTIYFNLQPQYDMDHKLRGFEALARMKDIEGNVISPGEFIPVAEKVGLIDRVDGAVFRKAAMFFGRLLRNTGADLILSINASVRHLMKNDFVDEIRLLLRDSGLPPENLEIEITESIMIDSVDKALQYISEIKKLGIKIAIDDFGTGYSSLSYLNRFPANLLKIDKSFIDKMNMGESSRQYVAAIISMGHVMGFDVISEGVEEPKQLDTLRSIGCDYIQGFIWGRPLSAGDALKLVEG